jgi:hypothetical protein
MKPLLSGMPEPEAPAYRAGTMTRTEKIMNDDGQIPEAYADYLASRTPADKAALDAEIEAASRKQAATDPLHDTAEAFGVRNEVEAYIVAESIRALGGR